MRRGKVEKERSYFEKIQLSFCRLIS